MSLEVIILAAGNGKRMLSDYPKVLHSIGGKPMLARVIETAQALSPKKIHVVCGIHTEQIKQGLGQDYSVCSSINWVYQDKPLGTGHAVKCVLSFLDASSQVLVLFGDVPLINPETLMNLREKTADHVLGLLLVNHPNPFGFGRVLRDPSGNIIKIREEKDASLEEKAIHEIFPGILLAKSEALARWLPQLTCNNAQQEYYLTDIIGMAVSEGLSIAHTRTTYLPEVQGVNDRVQLMALERIYQESLAHKWLLNGVGIADPKRFDVRGDFLCGQDTFIDVNVVFEGNNIIGKNCMIGPDCVIKNSVIADNVKIYAHSILDDVHVASGCEIGPFARVRPETILKENVKIGNFVEVKKTTIGVNSKASHLTYLGDALIGENVNIGAGTITCNYDGVNKHQTMIEDGAFIGSDTQLVAPVRVGKNATIGAGATIRKNVPDEYLSLNAITQKMVSGWKRPKKKD